MNYLNRKVLVLGLDGCTWKVFNPLIKAGLLPTFQKLVRNGVSGTLISTIPPSTSPAWPSMMTGLNPGKLGVYSTLRRSKSNVFSLKPVTSSVYKGKAVWDYLSDMGFYAALFKVPFLYPVYEINGCMVSGFGSASKFAAYPSHLYERLVRGPSSLLEAQLFNSLFTLNLDKKKECVRFIEQCKMLVQKESEVILELARSLPWDFLFYVVSPTDWLQHAFMDRIVKLVAKINLNPNNSLKLEIMDRAILDFYKSIDFLVGQFLKLVEQTSNDFAFFIVSDHGFTIRPYTFNLAKWLIKNRYMKLRAPRKQRKYRRNMISTLIRQTAELSKGAISGKLVEQLLKSLPSKTLRILKRTYLKATLRPGISEYIDFDNSKVFCLEDHGIYVNPTVRDVEKTLNQVISDLNEYLRQFPYLVLKTFKRSEIYWGDKVQLAPNLIIKIFDSNNQIWEISTDPTKPMIFKPPLPGIHDENGIFLAYGSTIKQNITLGKIMIWDVCPTILHFFGVQIPSNIDGKVLKQIFTKEIPKRYTARRVTEKEKIKRKMQKLKEKLLI